MIKYIIFDLDGVLVEARELHYEALNRALGQFGYTISRNEHLSTYDGLPTSRKLQLLTERQGLPPELYDAIWQAKQQQTRHIIDSEFTYDERMRGILRKLRAEGFRLAVCSNSTRETLKMMLLRKGLLEFVEFFLSNEDVKSPKPHPEIYWRAILQFAAPPKECLIVEDSHHGREAGIAAGAHVCGVKNSADVTYERIVESVAKINTGTSRQKYIPKWQGGNLKIIIPMAGEGKSFRKAGYEFPKPLVDIHGKPMIQWVVENINAEATFIFVVLREQYEKYNLRYLLNLIAPECEIVLLDKPTKGAALSVLAAQAHLTNDDPIAVVNCDQLLEWNSNEFFYAMAADECDGGIVTFESTHPQWSFVKSGPDGFITEVAEKRPISNQATAGVYYFKKAQEFVTYASQMIKKGISTNQEYFICPVYNEYIQDHKKIRTFPIKKMWSFSTPKDITVFLQEYASDTTATIPHQSPIPQPFVRTTAPVQLNIVIPMAGLGSRFVNAGFAMPKPFIDVAGITMIERVLENLEYPQARYILVVRKEHLEQTQKILRRFAKKASLELVTAAGVTEGAACTVLLAARLVNGTDPLLLANSDQLIDVPVADFIQDSQQRHLAGSILTFHSTHPKWSYAKFDEAGYLLEVKEKKVISEHATVGIYYYEQGRDFVTAASEMIAQNDRTNNEFYVAPTYNYLVAAGKKIGRYEISESQMHGLGTPEDLQEYLTQHTVPHKIAI